MGGVKQQGRMIEDKLKTLKKALIYSYQAGTAILADGREFRCLMNPDKLRNEYEDKIISIPFKDICLGRMIEDVDEQGKPIKVEVPAERIGTTTDGLEDIGMKPGDVFEWKENQSYWLVYLQYLEEYAYFRGECRRCYHEIDAGDGKKYKVYIQGPDENSIAWHTKKHDSWNDLNYKIKMYVTQDEITTALFHRFTKIKIEGKPYEVQAIDYLSNPGIITVHLQETFSNTIEESQEEKEEYIYVLKILEYSSAESAVTTASTEIDEENNAMIVTAEKTKDIDTIIKGPDNIYPYDRVRFYIEEELNGQWIIEDTKKARILNQTNTEAIVEILTSRKGNVNLIYRQENEDDIVYNIEIKSL